MLGGIVKIAKMENGGVNGEDRILYSLYRAFVGFSDVDTEDTKTSSAVFLCSHFQLSSSS